jgi:Domain of unknown function (DUF5666)
MTPSNPVVLGARWRRVCAALMVGTSLASLLVACGGGGDAPAAGSGAATAQSFSTGPISGLGSIIVNGVRFDDSAARIEDDDDGSAHSSRELKLGMMVEVQSSTIDDSTARAAATLVRFGSEIVGRVTSIDAAAQTLRMLDQTIEVRSNTVFDDSLAGGFAALAVGQVLEIHALFDASSNHYVATRIEDKANALLFRLRGRIGALDTGAKTFRIGDAVINYGNVPAGELPTLADGLRVRVRLQTTQVAGQWVAVTVRTGLRRVDDIADARIRGMVTAFTSAQQFEVQGIPVDATNAVFDPGAGAVTLGAVVEVRGRAAAGTIIASRVRVIDRHGDDWQRVELHGNVSALDTAAQTFTLRDVKVNYSRVIEWRDGRPADLADGKALEVKGVWSEDRRVLFAVVVEFE